MVGLSDFFGGGSEFQQSSDSRLGTPFEGAFFSNLAQAADIADNFGTRQIVGPTRDFNAGGDRIRALQDGPGQRAAGGGTLQTLQFLNNFDGLDRISAPQVTAQTAGEAALARAQTAGEAARARAAAINRGDIRNVQAGSFLNGNIDQFLNPVTDNVVDAALNDLNRARRIARQGDADAAAAAGAFGGTRQGVAEGETNRGFADAFARTSAGLRQGAFDRAAALQQSDFNRQLNAGLANQSQDARVALQNAGFTQQANLSNQQAINNRARLNAGLRQQTALANQSATNNRARFNAAQRQQAGLANQQSSLRSSLANQQAGIQEGRLQLGAAQQLSDQGRLLQQLDLQGIGALQNLGREQRDLFQQQVDANRIAPLEAQQIRNEALGLNPGGGSGIVSQSRGRQQSSGGIFTQPSFGDFLGGLSSLFDIGGGDGGSVFGDILSGIGDFGGDIIDGIGSIFDSPGSDAGSTGGFNVGTFDSGSLFGDGFGGFGGDPFGGGGDFGGTGGFNGGGFSDFGGGFIQDGFTGGFGNNGFDGSFDSLINADFQPR